MNTNGKVYHTLLNKINKNIICIIQRYNINRDVNNIYLAKLLHFTFWIKYSVDKMDDIKMKYYKYKINNTLDINNTLVIKSKLHLKLILDE